MRSLRGPQPIRIAEISCELGPRMQLNAPKWTPRQSVTQQGGLITIALNQSGLRFTGLSYLGWGVNDESISPEDS